MVSGPTASDNVDHFSACRHKDGKQQVQLTLTGKEASDYLNFVVKDTSSGTWYDQGGTNFHIPLTGSVATMSIDEQIPDAELPDLPGELCGIWSYIKWEHAGCPNRNEQQNQEAYKEAIAVSWCLCNNRRCCWCICGNIVSLLHSCVWIFACTASLLAQTLKTCSRSCRTSWLLMKQPLQQGQLYACACTTKLNLCTEEHCPYAVKLTCRGLLFLQCSAYTTNLRLKKLHNFIVSAMLCCACRS